MPEILYPLKRDWVFLLAASILLSLFGLWMNTTGESALFRCVGGIVAVGALVGLPIAVLHLLPNSSFLKISQEGLTIRSLWRTTPYRWVDISEFGVAKFRTERYGIQQDHQRVGFNFSRYSPLLQRATSPDLVRGRTGGYDAALPDTYGRDCAELAAHLNRRRNQFLGQ